MGSHDNPGLPYNNPAELLLCLAGLCEDHMGGSSGVVSITIFLVELEKLGEDLMYICTMSAHACSNSRFTAYALFLNLWI